MRVEVTRADFMVRAGGTVSEAGCRGCRAALAEDEATQGFCASCMALVACLCHACDESWAMARVPDLWPPCPKCGRRTFRATTAAAAMEVSE